MAALASAVLDTITGYSSWYPPRSVFVAISSVLMFGFPLVLSALTLHVGLKSGGSKPLATVYAFMVSLAAIVPAGFIGLMLACFIGRDCL